MKPMRLILPGVLLFAALLPFLALAKSAPHQDQSQSQTKPAPVASSDRGQQVFEQNCSRCHNAPEGFSSRISGTIARHMRARANLSNEDYQALRRFLNP
jgi:mono/diheme cytochrome c family protein